MQASTPDGDVDIVALVRMPPYISPPKVKLVSPPKEELVSLYINRVFALK